MFVLDRPVKDVNAKGSFEIGQAWCRRGHGGAGSASTAIPDMALAPSAPMYIAAALHDFHPNVRVNGGCVGDGSRCAILEIGEAWCWQAHVFLELRDERLEPRRRRGLAAAVRGEALQEALSLPWIRLLFDPGARSPDPSMQNKYLAGVFHPWP